MTASGPECVKTSEGFSFKASARLNVVEIAVDIELQQDCGVVSRSTSIGWNNAFKTQIDQVEFVGAIVIARWAWTLMGATAGVLLGKTDAHVAEEIRELVETPGDATITDLHVWQIGPQAHAAIVSVLGEGTANADSIRERLKPVPSHGRVSNGLILLSVTERDSTLVAIYC